MTGGVCSSRVFGYHCEGFGFDPGACGSPGHALPGSDGVSFGGRAVVSDRTQFGNDRRPNSKWIRSKMEFKGAFDRQVQVGSASGKV